eukprot:TRINITY_DN10964_c0_g1_i2.p1 TRINITY_DN10964_c0_g1~~TRINITY_DN10964_c0_g1_i2.p1  ORF type:complete len:317 (-),score=70.16 TRINITY_DN10964_c0_g1_i2:22-900(-)
MESFGALCAVPPASAQQMANIAMQVGQQPTHALGPPQLTPGGPLVHLPSALQLPAVPPLLPVPVGTQAVVGGERIAMPPQPAHLTRNVPSPEAVQAKKEQNFRDVDEHLQQAQLLLEEQTRVEKEFLRTQAAQAKEVAQGRWDQHLRTQELAAEQEYQKSLATIHESSRMMKLKLEEQAGQLTLEYQTRRTQEEINRHKHEVELHHWESQQRAGLRVRTLEEQIAQQKTLQQQLALRHNQAAKRSVGGLPELPLARWEDTPAGVPLGASPYPLALPAPIDLAQVPQTSSPTY